MHDTKKYVMAFLERIIQADLSDNLPCPGRFSTLHAEAEAASISPDEGRVTADAMRTAAAIPPSP